MTFTNKFKIYHRDKHLIVQTDSPTEDLILSEIKGMLKSYRLHQSIVAARSDKYKKPNFSLESVTYKDDEAIKITGNLQDAIDALAFCKSGGKINYDLPDSLSTSISNNSNTYFTKSFQNSTTTKSPTKSPKIEKKIT